MIQEYARKKDGFDIVMKSDGWQMAVVTYEEQYDETNKKKVARHLSTDEAFVLIMGDAILFTTEENDQQKEIKLMKNKIYVVEKGTWHSLILSKDAIAVAVENANVKPETTERKVLG